MAMSKEEIVRQGVGLIQAGVETAVGQIYDIVEQDVRASLPEDTTPHSAADLEAARAEQKAADEVILEEAKASLQSTIADLNLKLSQKNSDALEEAVADELAALAQKLRDRTVAAPAPVEPEVPAEEPEVPAEEPTEPSEDEDEETPSSPSF